MHCAFKQDVQPAESPDAALLMLDISSAKSQLRQLQKACEAAAEEHARTKFELLSCQQQRHDVQGTTYALEAMKTPRGCRTVAQQLQALHTENLHLKASLKREVEARQLVEAQHNELLELLRSGRLLELLAAGYMTPAAQPVIQPSLPTVGEVYRRITEGYVTPSDQAQATRQAAAACAQGSTAAGAASQNTLNASTVSSSPWRLSSKGCAQKSTTAQSSTPEAGAGPASMPAVPGTLSASRQRPCVAAAADEPVSSSANQAAAPSTWQDSMQQSLFAKLTQQDHTLLGGAAATRQGLAQQALATGLRSMQQQQAQSTPAMTRQQHQQLQQQHPVFMQIPAGQQQMTSAALQGYTSQHSKGDEVPLSNTTSSSSSQSPNSALLDSDDLDELAGLCDSLLQHRNGQVPPVQQERQQHERQPCPQAAPAGWGAASQGPASAQQKQQQQHEVSQQAYSPMPPGLDADTRQACVPGLQALAAQLRQLQEQVTATALDTAPSARADCTSTHDGSHHGSSFNNTWGSLSGQHSQCSTRYDERAPSASGTAAAAADAATGRSGQHGNRSQLGQQHSSSRDGSSADLQDEVGDDSLDTGCEEGSVMTSLQQQLARRMLEVKQRLSSLCNDMMQDPPAAAAAAAATAPTAAPAPAGAGPGTSSGGASSRLHSAFFSPPGSPGAAAAAPRGQQKQHASAAAATTPLTGSSAGAAASLGQPGVVRGGAPATSCHSGSSHSGIKVATNSSSSAGQATEGFDPDGAAAAAAAFAAIKACIDSSSDLGGGAPDAATGTRAQPTVGGTRSRGVGVERAATGDAAPTAAAAQGIGGGSAAAAAAGGGSSCESPAAAGQGLGDTVWAGGDAGEQVSTEESEGSWATVDDSEQEQLQQQQQECVVDGVWAQQQHSKTCRRSPTGFERGALNNGSNSSSSGSGSGGIVQDDSSNSSFSHESTGAAGRHSSSPTSPMPSSYRTTSQHGSAAHPQQQRQQHQQQHQQPGVHVWRACSAGGHHTVPPKKKTWHDPEQPVSPVSCESSLAAGRMPAEVVFSPHKNPPSGQA